MPGLPELKIQEKPSFADFKRSAITQFLKKASSRIKAYQPNCIVSAAVKPNIYNARNTFGQEWDLWLTAGYIDWAVPMNYTGNNQLFDNNLQIIYEPSASVYHFHGIHHNLNEERARNVVRIIEKYQKEYQNGFSKLKKNK